MFSFTTSLVFAWPLYIRDRKNRRVWLGQEGELFSVCTCVSVSVQLCVQTRQCFTLD